MKNVIFIAFSLLILSACKGKDAYQIGEKTKMEITKKIDAGTVALGEKVKTKIIVKNVGTYPLILAEVKGSCSCTVTDYPKEPIAPGKTIEIPTEIATSGVGRITKDVRITANTEPSITTVVITANVIGK